MKEYYCAICGNKLEYEAYMFTDNYLQLKYFEDYKSNRFCSKACACEAIMLDAVPLNEIPLDDDEENEEDEDYGDE